VPFLELVKATTNPIEALTMVQEGNIDLVFLDVQMYFAVGKLLYIRGRKWAPELIADFARQRRIRVARKDFERIKAHLP